MSDILVPVFNDFPEEASIIGRLLSGYGELDFAYCLCAERALRKPEHPRSQEVGHKADSRHIALKALYRLKSESNRLQVADALARSEFTSLSLHAEYSDAVGAIRHCLKIRNQYAHCHWGADDAFGDYLFLTDLEENALGAGDFELSFNWKHISLDILKDQLAYFEYTKQCLDFIHGEFRVRAKMASSHMHAMPKKLPQPPLHSHLSLSELD